jgi:preprotein translocase subunit SecA
MRRGIGLRGYAQQDPLNEFKKEAFGLYEELRALIRHQVATTIFRVTVTRGPAPGSAEEQLASDLAAGADAIRGGAGGTAAGGQKGGRNEGNAAIGPGASPIHGLPKGPDMRGTESLGERALGDGSGAAAAGASASGGGGAGPAVNGALRPGFTPAGARIGRNDPCFCGSGLKYKKCHGR